MGESIFQVLLQRQRPPRAIRQRSLLGTRIILMYVNTTVQDCHSEKISCRRFLLAVQAT